MKTVFIPASRKLSGYNNGDYTYNWQLLQLSKYAADLTTKQAHDIGLDIRTSLGLAAIELRLRLKLPIPRALCWRLSEFYRLPRMGADIMSADALIAYERYPENSPLPVIWIANPTDIETKRSRGMTEGEIQRELEFKRRANQLAQVTVLMSDFKKTLFDKEIQPERPTQVIPYFQPLKPISPGSFSAKWDHDRPKKISFVGRTALRKGLPLVLGAYEILRKRHGDKICMHVVSSLSDGAVEIPDLPGLVYSRRVSNNQLADFMRDSHYLVMPSDYETYGWVYIEAMSKGAVPVATDFPVQRDLLDNGKAGLLVERTAAAIASAIETGLERPATARALAVSALALWKNRYAPEVVARQFSALAHAVSPNVASSVREVKFAGVHDNGASIS